MKKISICIIILLMAIGMFQISYANEEKKSNISVIFSGETKVVEDTKTVTYTISLGEFKDIPENAIIGYEAVLEYDDKIFSNVKVEGTDNWTVGYSHDTKRLMGESKSAVKENEETAKITFTLKENVEAGETTIKLNKGLLTVNDDDSLDMSFEKEKKVTIVKKKKLKKTKKKMIQIKNQQMMKRNQKQMIINKI